MTIEDFNEAFRKYSGGLYYYASKMLNDTEAAKDLVQDCFLELYKHLAHSTPTTCKSFLFITCKTRGINVFRRKFVDITKKTGFSKTLHESYDPNILDNLISAEFMMLIMQEIELIPGECRKRVFKLTYIYQLSAREIAALLNISYYTVKEHKQIALRHMKKVCANLKIPDNA